MRATTPLLLALALGTQACTDNDAGATDAYGDSCSGYLAFPSWCGQYDDADFSSEGMCCGCGGGLASSPSPPAPPAPPPSPPAPPNSPMHESCHFTVRSTRGASMTQIGELTFYDQSGSKIDVASISSECEPITGESAYEAVDGSAYTKWLCSPFAYPVPDAPKCDDDCLSSSNGICSNGGPGAEYSSCDFGTDCTDCGARNYTAPTLTIDFVGRHVVHTYELTTADDEPDRDPTSWTLACVEPDGSHSEVSVVDGVVPPTDRYTNYGATSLFPFPPSPPPAPPAPPPPSLPPTPPRDPPGVTKHEACHLTVRAVRGGGSIMQLAELTVFDSAGAPLPVFSAASACEYGWDKATDGVDSDDSTKWVCAPYAYNAPTVCGDSGVNSDECWYANDDYCNDGGPGSESGNCPFGEDCSDCGPRQYPAPTLDIELEGHHLIYSYQLTTADDEPANDPTSWTLECTDRDGSRTMLSEVNDIEPPEERGREGRPLPLC